MNVADFYPVFLSSEKVTIDSRNVAEGDLFFAFSGENYNGAEYARKAIEQGAKAVIVEDSKYADENENIFYVSSTLSFLQELARHHRSMLEIPIIALTGSNGKTTTKELMHAVLARKYNVQYTRGNLNNHIGVPLTLLSIKAQHEMAIVEMGANHQREIELLCSIAQPTLGYITNFGKAHLEGFGGFEGVIAGKSELYAHLKTHGKTLLVNEADPLQNERTVDYHPKITFGAQSSDYEFQPLFQQQRVGLIIKDQHVFSQLTGEYNYTNLCAAAALGLHFEVDLNEIVTALEEYAPTNMRSQILNKDGKTLVLDTYNANPSSMEAALRNFVSFSGSKSIIIGDMLELGIASNEEHRKILDFAKSLQLDEIITVGKCFKEVNAEGAAFENAAALNEYLKENRLSGENILLKASRGIALESVLDFIR